LREGVTLEEVQWWIAEESDSSQSSLETFSELVATQEKLSADFLGKQIVPTFGKVPVCPTEGDWCLIYGNFGNLSTAKTRNWKAAQIRTLASYYQANFIAGNEVGVNMSFFKSSCDIASLLGFDTNSSSTYAYKKHENFGRCQRGGCALIALGKVCQYVHKTKGGRDFRGLGRYDSFLLYANPGIKTRLACGYNVGGPKPKGLGTMYQQYLRYTQTHNLNVSPRKLMADDLIKQVKQWMGNNEEIILVMDANEHVVNGPLCRRLANLGLSPMATRLHGTPPNTHVNGTQCIDEVWTTPGIEVTGIQISSFHESFSDHRAFIVDFTSRSAIGLYAHRILRGNCRRLTLKNEPATEKYISLKEEQMRIHRMDQQLQRAAQLASYPPTAPFVSLMNLSTNKQGRSKLTVKQIAEKSANSHRHTLSWASTGMNVTNLSKPCYGA
jgi:hypothetical protein